MLLSNGWIASSTFDSIQRGISAGVDKGVIHKCTDQTTENGANTRTPQTPVVVVCEDLRWVADDEEEEAWAKVSCEVDCAEVR